MTHSTSSKLTTCTTSPMRYLCQRNRRVALLDDAACLYPDRIALDYFGAPPRTHRCASRRCSRQQVLHEAGAPAWGLGGHRASNRPQALLLSTRACVDVAAQHNPRPPPRRLRGAGTPRRQGCNRGCGVGPYRSMLSTRCLRSIFARHADVTACFVSPVARARQTPQSVAWARPRRRAPGTVPRPRPRRLIRTILPPPQAMTAVILHTSGNNGVPKSCAAHSTAILVPTSTSACSGWKLHEVPKRFFLPYPLLPCLWSDTLPLCVRAQGGPPRSACCRNSTDGSTRNKPTSHHVLFAGARRCPSASWRQAYKTVTDITSIRYA